MAIWRVKATWMEDDAEASEQWDVTAATAHDALKEVTARLRFQPHHVEARLRPPKDARTVADELHPGELRRVTGG